MGRTFVAVVLAVGLVGCAPSDAPGDDVDAAGSRSSSATSDQGGGGATAEGGGDVEGPPDEAPPSQEADASAKLACRHFRNVMGDVADGVLTSDEIRTKMLEVRESARVSEEPGIPDAATELVAAATADDGEAFLGAVDLMHLACQDAGL